MILTPTLTGYVARAFLGMTLAMLGALTGLVALFDFIELLRRAATRPDVGFAIALEIASLRLPFVSLQILPFAILLGGIVAFWRLTRSSELIVARAAGNGVNDLRLLTADEARALEPALDCRGAVLSPSTGIVDSHGLMLALQGDLEHAGGLVALHANVHAVLRDGTAWRLQADDGTELLAERVVNAAGLQACALAQAIEGMPAGLVPRPFYAKGSYFTLSGRSPFTRLIYPAPEPDKHLAGLGVHLTIDLGGQAKFGPDVQWVDDPADLQVDPARGEAFYAEVRRYWPGLPDGALLPGYAGMRPKISGPHEPAADFVVQGPAEHGLPGLVNLLGIESPGLTSCLAIGELVAERLSAGGASWRAPPRACPRVP